LVDVRHHFLSFNRFILKNNDLMREAFGMTDGLEV